MVLITKDNYAEYITLPNHILDKMAKGEMTLTHFFDIVRMALFYKHGRLWIDYREYRPEEIFENDFLTLKTKDLFPDFIS